MAKEHDVVIARDGSAAKGGKADSSRLAELQDRSARGRVPLGLSPPRPRAATARAAARCRTVHPTYAGGGLDDLDIPVGPQDLRRTLDQVGEQRDSKRSIRRAEGPQADLAASSIVE